MWVEIRGVLTTIGGDRVCALVVVVLSGGWY